MIKPECLIVNAEVANVAVPEKRLLSIPAMPSNDESWETNDLVEGDEGERVGVKRLFRDLQNSCHTKRERMLERVSLAAGLSVEFVGDLDGSPTAGAQLFSNPCREKSEK